MFIPLHDDSPLKVIRFQFVTGAIIAINFLVVAYTSLALGTDGEVMLAYLYGTIPVLLSDGSLFTDAGQAVPEPLTLVTYQFMHAGWMHLLSNMLFLWVFADNIEDAYGHFGFLVFYLFCGIVAALTHVLMQPDSTAPLVGASGAVAGVMGSYLVLYPKARIWILVLLRIPLRISAIWALAAWLGFQVFMLFLPQDGDVAVAWWAHIGGFIAGAALTYILSNRLRERLASERP